MVLCDLCNKNYSRSKKSGGFIFESKAVCPDCSIDFLKKIRKYNEERFIKAFCPKGVSFNDFVIKYNLIAKEGGIDEDTLF